MAMNQLTDTAYKPMPQIGSIMASLEERQVFDCVERIRYPYDPYEALETVEAIGRRLNPRFVIDDENRFAYLNFIRWMHADPDFQCIDPESGQAVAGDLLKGLYVAGSPGTGKTWLMSLMCNYSRAMGFRIKFPAYEKTERRDLAWPSLHAEDICEAYLRSGSIADFAGTPMLAIQDMGAERRETVYMGNRVDVVRLLIEKRADLPCKITLATSNMKIQGEVLRARYGDKVYSRMRQMFNYLELKGRDRRK